MGLLRACSPLKFETSSERGHSRQVCGYGDLGFIADKQRKLDLT